MKKINRKFNTRRIRLTKCYYIQEVSKLYAIHKNTVLLWIKSGLKIIDDRKPYLIKGFDLKYFLDQKQAHRKSKCQINELYCFKCRKPRMPNYNTVKITPRTVHIFNIQGHCNICDCKMNKNCSMKKLTEIEKIFTITTQHLEHIIECA